MLAKKLSGVGYEYISPFTLKKDEMEFESQTVRFYWKLHRRSESLHDPLYFVDTYGNAFASLYVRRYACTYSRWFGLRPLETLVYYLLPVHINIISEDENFSFVFCSRQSIIVGGC